MIQNKNHDILWEQFSLGPDSMRPYFVIPGKEEPILIEQICEKMDQEAEECEIFVLEIETVDLTIIIKFHLGLDGKLIEMTTGLSKNLFSQTLNKQLKCKQKHLTFHRWSLLYCLPCHT